MKNLREIYIMELVAIQTVVGKSREIKWSGKKMSANNLFWFNNLKLEPSYDLSIQNDKVDKLVKQMEVNAYAKKKALVIHDPIVSKILQATVYYVSTGKRNQLLRCLYKNCSIETDISKFGFKYFYIKLDLRIGKYIFVESQEVSTRKLSVIFEDVQSRYDSHLSSVFRDGDLKKFMKQYPV